MTEQTSAVKNKRDLSLTSTVRGERTGQLRQTQAEKSWTVIRTSSICAHFSTVHKAKWPVKTGRAFRRGLVG